MSKITAALLEIKTEAFLTPTLRVQKAAPLALTSFRSDTRWKEESPCPSVYPAGMAYAGVCSLAARSTTQTSLYPTTVEELAGPKCKALAQTIGL